MAGSQPVSTRWRVSAVLLAVAAVATIAGFVVLEDRQGGLGYWIAMIPVVLVIGIGGAAGLVSARSAAGRGGRVGLVLAWIATVLLVLIAVGLLSSEAWEPPPPA